VIHQIKNIIKIFKVPFADPFRVGAWTALAWQSSIRRQYRNWLSGSHQSRANSDDEHLYVSSVWSGARTTLRTCDHSRRAAVLRRMRCHRNTSTRRIYNCRPWGLDRGFYSSVRWLSFSHALSITYSSLSFLVYQCDSATIIHFIAITGYRPVGTGSCPKGQQGPPVHDKSELAFLHLRLLPDGTLSVAILHVQTLDFVLFDLCIFSNHGVARATSYGSSTRDGLTMTRYGFSISENAQSGCVVAHTRLSPTDSDFMLQELVFDGFRGRLCYWSISQVEILDYV